MIWERDYMKRKESVGSANSASGKALVGVSVRKPATSFKTAVEALKKAGIEDLVEAYNRKAQEEYAAGLEELRAFDRRRAAKAAELAWVEPSHYPKCKNA